METLNTVLRSVRRETEERHNHLDIFREFLDHLGRATHRNADDLKPTDRRAATR
jgi:uncharacterized protein YukE